MPLEAHARAALAELDRAIAAQPHMEGQTFSAATHQLCALRDRLAARPQDAATRRRQLEQLNGVISVVLAGHFPLGPVPWAELQQARASLAEFVTEMAP